MANCRFCPNINGGLHLGHLFTLLVNEYIAHTTGGKFYIRFDDTCFVSTRTGKKMKTIFDAQMVDLEWLNIKMDGWIKQSDIIDDVHNILKAKKFEYVEEKEEDGYVVAVTLRQDNSFVTYPYCSRQTAERVVMDNMLDITHVIRGEDFMTEVSYYSYVCQRLNFPIPEFWFLPRLASGRGDISKTSGGFTIAEFRANGYTADELKDVLAKTCLANAPNGWNFYNIKHSPVFNI
jgi:glutamyl/glutaminyl-tRNA synthetase